MYTRVFGFHYCCHSGVSNQTSMLNKNIKPFNLRRIDVKEAKTLKNEESESNIEQHQRKILLRAYHRSWKSSI